MIPNQLKKILAASLLCLFSVTLVSAQESESKKSDSESKGVAVYVGKIFTCGDDDVIADGTILIKDGKIEAIGTRKEIKVPEDYEVVDHSDQFAMPGLVEAHSHVGGSGDLNEMVYQTNPELRNWDQIIPHNDQLKVAIAGGVTTICYIPGSGTNMGGFGVLMKAGPGKAEDVIIRAPGVLKIAQAGNPERRGGETGSCLLYTSPSPRDKRQSRMPSSA